MCTSTPAGPARWSARLSARCHRANGDQGRHAGGIAAPPGWLQAATGPAPAPACSACGSGSQRRRQPQRRSDRRGGFVHGGSLPRRPRMTAAAPTRVLLADDQALLRAAFRVLIESADDMEVVGEASTGQAVDWPGPAAPTSC